MNDDTGPRHVLTVLLWHAGDLVELPTDCAPGEFTGVYRCTGHDRYEVDQSEPYEICHSCEHVFATPGELVEAHRLSELVALAVGQYPVGADAIRQAADAIYLCPVCTNDL